MAGARKRRGGRRRKRWKRRKRRASLDLLKPEDAQSVLRGLLGAHPELTDEAESIAGALLSDVSFESVADALEFELRLPDLEELNARSVGHGMGYVEPSEVAWEILDKVVEPYLEDMKRLASLGLDAKALDTCRGLVLGLYRVRDEEGDVFGWAPDFPADAAEGVLREWGCGTRRKGGPGRRSATRPAFSRQFVERYLPEWKTLIARAIAEL